MDSLRRLELIRIEYHAVAAAVRVFALSEPLPTLQRDACELRDRIHALLSAADTNSTVFDPPELQQLRTSSREMMQCIDDHEHLLKDAARGPAPTAITAVPTGGRPRLAIDLDFLSTVQDMHTNKYIARELNCSARTVRRRRLEAALTAPSPTVFIPSTNPRLPPGTFLHNPASRGRASPLPLPQALLDNVVLDILTEFKEHGISMVQGQLRARGYHHVSRAATRASIIRVSGVPIQFGRTPIARREYRVAGPSSLWHHDGQHGLIEYKIVIHGFIDGYSRFVVGIRASNNNRATTVDNLFVDIITEHGVPSRLRGDHGVENVRVADRMEQLRGRNRGSYIWGKSIHNVRIERLWVDVVRGFVTEWKNLFRDLEANAGLRRADERHIWLLHHLYLGAINAHALSWADGWNNHTFSRLPDHPPHLPLPTPRSLFLLGVYRNGVRAMQYVPEDINPDELAHYGVDWPAHEDNQVMRVYRQYNPPELPEHDQNPDGFGRPRRLVDVNVPEPAVPFDADTIAALDLSLARSVDLETKDMTQRRAWWVHAVEFLGDLL